MREQTQNVAFEEFEDDFEATPAMYQVWLSGYRGDMSYSGFRVMANESKSPEGMIKYAELFAAERRYETLSIPKDVEYLEITVETAVKLDGAESQEGTLFRTAVKLH